MYVSALDAVDLEMAPACADQQIPLYCLLYSIYSSGKIIKYIADLMLNLVFYSSKIGKGFTITHPTMQNNIIHDL